MGVMTALDTSGRFTEADFEALPDDGRRYELLDGAFVVSPFPGCRHQQAGTALWRLLEDAAPSGVVAVVAPLDTYLPTGDILEPDVLVIDLRIVVDDEVRGTPLLAVEVFSPSSRRRDVGDKLTAYRDAGVPNYWVVDPIHPRLRVWALRDGDYVEVADVHDDEELTAEAPYAVTVVPRALVV